MRQGGASGARADEPALGAATERRLVALMFARLALSLSSFGILLLLDGIGVGPTLGEGERRGLYWTLAFAFGATALSGVFFERARAAAHFATFQIATDVGIVSSLVHFSGGHESVFAFLYVVVTAYGAVLFDRRSALGAALACTLAYGGVLAADQLGLGVGDHPAHAVVAVATWGVHVGALLLVAMLASALSTELRLTGAALDRSAHDLRRLRDLNARIVQSLNSGLLTTDPAGRVSSFNPEAERITGRRAADVVGARVDDVLPGTWSLIGASRREQLDPVRRARVEYRTSAGARRHLGLAASALRDAGGTPIGHVVIFQDVTDVVDMETKLTRSERLAAVGEMAAKIAHEIRNPLAAISGSVQILSKDLGDPTAPDPSRLMGIVVREADRLSGLITDFLGYARPRRPKSESIALHALCEEVVEMLATACPDHVAIELVCEEAVEVQGDPDQIRQLLWNLCRNGIESMAEPGCLRLRVRSAPASQAGRAEGRRGDAGVAGESPSESGPSGAEIVVEDEGCGIDEEAAGRLFEPFFTTKTGGSGLGLATVHRIVEAHGGQIDVEANGERGTRFIVWLPARTRGAERTPGSEGRA